MKKVRESLIVEYYKLGHQGRGEHRSIMNRKADQDTCILCRKIRDNDPDPDFPKEARIIHFMICCDPQREFNAKYKTSEESNDTERI